MPLALPLQSVTCDTRSFRSLREHLSPPSLPSIPPLQQLGLYEGCGRRDRWVLPVSQGLRGCGSEIPGTGTPQVRYSTVHSTPLRSFSLFIWACSGGHGRSNGISPPARHQPSHFFVVCFQPSPGCTSARGQIDSTSVLFGRFWAGDELRFLPYGRPTLEPPLIAFAPPLSSRRPHLVHCMLAASHVWERELYEKIRALYNSIHPVECNLAPPFEEWTGMRGFCDHIFCRCTFLVNVAPLTKIAPVKRMQSVSM